MIAMDQFKDANGHYDFVAYGKARVEAGEICASCHGYLSYLDRRAAPGPIRCAACERMDKDNRPRHPKLLRCPACQHRFEPDAGVLTEAVHENGFGRSGFQAWCPSCDAKFRGEVYVEYELTSPPAERSPGNTPSGRTL